MIAIQNEDGSIDAVRCHYDGGPEVVGEGLLASFQEADCIRRLIAGGELKYIDEGGLHEHYTEEDGRDEAKHFLALEEAMNYFIDGIAEYFYLWDGEWSFIARYGLVVPWLEEKRGFKSLKDELQ